MFQDGLFFLMQAIMMVLIAVMVYSLSQMKKRVDKIINEVQEYINFITEETEAESITEGFNIEKNFQEEKKFSQSGHRKTTRKEMQEEAQTHLIQAVLGEYFP